jgi:diguanylate cyclase (GGDEF)-like protein/PAS domain S-box-containing protein
MADVGSWEWDVSSNAMTWSNELFGIFGLERRESAASVEEFLQRVHPQDRGLVHGALQRAYSERKPVSFDHRVICPDGTERWLHGQAAATTEGADRGIRLAGTTQDITERKRAEERMLDSERELRDYLDNMTTFSAKLALDGSFLLVGKTAELASGLSHEELMLANFLDGSWWAFDPEVQGRVKQAFRRAISGEAVNYDERLFVFGQVLTINFSLVPVRDDQGRVSYVLAEGRDITAQKRIEAKFQGLVEAAPDAMVGVDDRGLIQLANRQTEVLFGYDREELIGRPIEILVPERFQGVHASHRERYSAHPQTRPMGAGLEMAGRRKDGTEFPVDISLSFIETEQGPLVTAAVRDSTERIRAERALRESEERFRKVFAEGPTGMALLGEDFRFLEVNESLARVLGYTRDELAGLTFSAITHPADLDLDVGLARKLLDGEIPSYQIEKRCVSKSGEALWISFTASVVRGAAGSAPYGLAIIENITARKGTEKALRDAKERFASAFDNAPIGMALTSLEGGFLQVNRALCRMTGYSEEELLASQVQDLSHPDDIDAERPYLDQVLSGEIRGYQIDKRYRHADGRTIWVLVNMSLVTDSDGRALHFILQAEDVTQRKQAEEQLVHRSLHDPLTELPNRMLFMDRLAQALRREERRPGSVAVMFLDLDHFKVINDSMGHEAGDQVLGVIASRLQSILRPGDTVSRFGGDEFVILCEDILDERQAVRIADRLARTVTQPLPLPTGDVVVTASLGIALAMDPTDRPEALIRDADAALYRAKERGRARHELFDAAMGTRAVKRMQTENELRQAIELGQLRLHYQPVVRAGNGQIAGVEALVRWEHPEKGLLGPGEFISVAEETGLIEPLGSWVLHEACLQYGRWQAGAPEGPPLVMAVNLSARELGRQGFVERVAETLAAVPMDPTGLCLEITETVLMEATPSALSALHELRKIGVSLAIDDFGTGYSSLTYLKRFQVDSLKVDRSFVDGLGRDPEDTAIVTAVVALAHALGLSTVAEGVESHEQLEQVQSLGCDFVQGYYFAPPQPAEILQDILASDRVLQPSDLTGDFSPPA